MGTEIVDFERAALAGNANWALVQRVSASASFQNSPRLRELLLHICERALLNRPDDLREQLIGCRVFLRKPDYNPGNDNIVRVEVRRLRARLEGYFNSEGLDEPVVVSIPKGSYLPVFQPRENTPAEDVSPVVSAIAEPTATTVAVPVAPGRRWYWLAAITALAIALVSVGFWAGRRKGGTAASGPAADWSPLWPAIFNQSQQTLIVCADSALVMAQTLRRSPISLDDYTRHRYITGAGTLGEDARRVFGLLAGWTWTDLADVRLVDRLHRVNARLWDGVSIRTARTTQIHDFTSGNAVILGSTQSNPWNALFEQQLNFRIEWDERTRTALVRNKAPLAGEQSVYPAPPGSVVYGTIAFIPNLRGNGSVLIIAGTDGQGTEAAGEFITNAAACSRFMRILTSRNGGELPYFDVLLKSGKIEGIAKNAEVVAYRVLAPARAKPGAH